MIDRWAFTGKVISGAYKIPELDRRGMEDYYKRHEGQLITLTLQPGAQDRSTRQNSFFHGPLIDAFVRATGETDRIFLKEWLKKEFLTTALTSRRGKAITFVRGTSALTVAEMSDFMEKCLATLIDWGGALTQPEINDYKGAQ